MQCLNTPIEQSLQGATDLMDFNRTAVKYSNRKISPTVWKIKGIKGKDN